MKLKLSYSVTIYFTLIFIVACFLSNIGSFQGHATGFLLYMILIVIAAYLFLSRYSCRLQIDQDDILHIRYLMPWNKNRVVKLKDYKYMDYGRGFYGFVESRKNGHLNLLRIPQDTIVLSDSMDFKLKVAILKVNLRMGQFKELLNYLENVEKLKFADSAGAGGYFW